MAAPRKRRAPEPLRPTLWDTMRTDGSQNLYCRLDALTNEASVETFFISRLLADLGYGDSQIQTKQTLEFLTVGRGHRRERYKPDYALVVDDFPRCIMDAKGTQEDIDEWIEQCSGYCLALNRKYPTGENPVRYFMLSNGIATKIYQWDSDTPILELTFTDFTWGNQQYEQLRTLLSAEKIAEGQEKISSSHGASFTFTRPTSEWARHLFALCHDIIRKSGYGPAPAFMEFVKIMFVKLWADRALRENPATCDILADGQDVVKLPSQAIIFSVRWIEERTVERIVNPLDTLIFARLRQDIETNIALRKKKRLFDRDEHIDLRPDVVKAVVAKLEHYDMFGVDEDLNGRLFETFLSATMRGRDLGQFFTPRSVVKMMARLADLRADRSYRDKVIDACCGTGGFLIEILTIMRNKIRNNSSLSRTEQEALLEDICNECIYGIDFGKNPPLARIARINMYLHGDGGSCIYATDGLDKQIDTSLETDPETVQNLQELQARLHAPILFDVVLTNPPFSMPKEATNETDWHVMSQYSLTKKSPGTAELRPSLLSSVMFLERYYDLLRPGGKLITVLDDTLLGGKEFGYVRTYIREHFLVRAIISLPGNAFRRSGSRIKTSVLLLEKKHNPDDTQPSCFTFFAEQLGIDDLTPRASQDDIDEARGLATAETERIISGYQQYLHGEPGIHILSPDHIADRLDLKYCVPLSGRLVPQWEHDGIEVKRFADCVARVENVINPSTYPDTLFTLIKVNYEGRCIVERTKFGRAIKYKTMYRVKAGQVVFSIIRATDGAIGIVPEELDGALVSESYAVFQCEQAYDAIYLWALLRSHELRADMQSLSHGASRYYTYWPEAGRILLPWLGTAQRQEISARIVETWNLEKQIEKTSREAMQQIVALGVESQESLHRWSASKAPS